MSTKRMLLAVLVASVVVLAVGIGPGAHALPPDQEPDPPGVAIPYSGRLSDEAGQPVPDGAYDFAFALYDGLNGGELLWSEVQREVMVEGGSFMTLLGSVNGIPKEVLDGKERWLAVAVRGPAEAAFTALSPRQRVSAAAPAAPSGPTGGAACPHDHFGEVWSGSVTSPLWDHPAFKVTNSGDGPAVWGEQTKDSPGVYGTAETNYGVWGYSDSGRGVYGSSLSGHGVYGFGYSEHGVYGQTDGDWSYRSGVYGLATHDHANGVTGWNTGAGVGVYGSSATGYAGYFSGSVHVTGNLTKGGGGFKIDHPLDPEDQYLYHSFVESPDMKNVYDGVVVLDANGEAWVELPAWFEALNKDFRYQLTPIGAPGPSLYIAQEIQNNRFQIAGGTPGLKVSWQVTGIRHDPYAEAHPIPVEEAKPAEERGTYLHPVEYGQPATSGLDTRREQGPGTGGER